MALLRTANRPIRRGLLHRRISLARVRPRSCAKGLSSDSRPSLIAGPARGGALDPVTLRHEHPVWKRTVVFVHASKGPRVVLLSQRRASLLEQIDFGREWILGRRGGTS